MTEDEIRVTVAYSDWCDVAGEYNYKLNELQILRDTIKHVKNMVGELENYGVYVQMPSLDTFETSIYDKIRPIENEINIWNKYIIEKRNNCNHNWVYDGHDSHYDYCKCSRCGKERKE